MTFDDQAVALGDQLSQPGIVELAMERVLEVFSAGAVLMIIAQLR